MVEVALSATCECFELRRAEVRSVEVAERTIARAHDGRVIHRGLVPDVAEAQDRRVHRHHVDSNAGDEPAADRCPFFLQLREAERTEASLQRIKLHA